jgi:HAMP domain-containing protein
MTEELVEKLRNAVTYGYMPRLMREVAAEAANAIEAQAAEIERLTYDGIHTCHDDFPRLPCVQRREIDALQAEVRHLTNELQAHKDALAQADPKP